MTGFATGGRGVWCDDSSPGAVARLARSGFDWVCLDAQHGLYSRAEIVEAARVLPRTMPPISWSGSPPCDFAGSARRWTPARRAVIVPQIESPEGQPRAVAATFYPPLRSAQLGPFGRTWGGRATDPEADERPDHGVRS